MEKIRWNNDYSRGAHAAVLQALAETNEYSYEGYGLDTWCGKAADEIRNCLDCGREEADIHFLPGGTQTNYTVIAAALRSYQGVISADTAHIHTHETGAVEHAGRKILTLPGKNGKLTAENIAAEAEKYRTSGIQEHITQPKMVFLSFPSEYGTLYSRRELKAIREVCSEYGMYLYIDGARMSYGLASPRCDLTAADLAWLADAFYIGGTKCGALFGEAAVLLNDDLKDHFRSCMKQNGAMLAKSWLMGLQFHALFKDGLYFEIARRADQAAMRLKDAFAAAGIPFYLESFTNQQFVIVTGAQMELLGRRHIFEYDHRAADGRHCIRFCTSWSTRDEDLESLISDIATLK